MSLLRRLERENLDVPSPEERAANLLGAFGLAVHDGLEQSLRAGPRPLSPSAAAALQILRELPGIQLVELRLALGITHSACVRIVDQLQRVGLVRRSPDPDDARATRLEVTPEGTSRARSLTATRDAFTRALVRRIPPYWLPRMVRVLELLLSVMTPDARSALRACRHCNWSVCRVDSGAPCPVVKAAILREATADAEVARARQTPWWHDVIPPEERPPLPPLEIRPRSPRSNELEVRRLLAIARHQAAPGARQGRRRWR